MPSADLISDLPLAWYLQTASENRRAVFVARDRLIGNCMREAGFDWIESTYVPDPDFLARRYGLLDIDWARENGYRSSDYLNSDEPMEADNLPQNPSEQTAYLLALDGPPASTQDSVPMTSPINGDAFGSLFLTGGCSGEANVEIFGSVDAYVDYTRSDLAVQLMAEEALSRALSDQPVLDAERHWAQCMTSKGYAFQTMSDLQAYAEENGLGLSDLPTPDETSLAAADVECRLSSSYAAILNQAEVTHQQQLIDTTSLDMSEIEGERARVLERATKFGPP